MKNNDLRAEIVQKGVYAYQVAEKMGIKPNSLTHMLRGDLSKSQKTRIRKAIAEAEKAKDLSDGKEETK